MTREEAIKKIKKVIEESVIFEDELEAFDMAIKALSRSKIPNTCGDAISRQAAQDYIARYLSQYLYYDVREAVEVIDAFIGDLPPVTPQQRMGRWIEKEEEGDAEPFIIWECSECHCVCEDGKPSYKYCPQCGANMEAEDI